VLCIHDTVTVNIAHLCRTVCLNWTIEDQIMVGGWLCEWGK